MKTFAYQEIASTQDLAKDYLNQANTEIALITAKKQTAAYGKRGRSFYSPANTGIYLSLAFPDFTLSKEKGGLLTLTIGVEIVNVLKSFFAKHDFRLKWVNDIYLNDKKVAGILVEKVKNGLVVGLGININTQNFPENLKKKAGSIDSDEFDRQNLTFKLAQAIIKASKTYETEDILPEYRSLSNILNREVALKVGNKQLMGKVVAIDNLGRLVIAQGEKQLSFSSGEVTKVYQLKNIFSSETCME